MLSKPAQCSVPSTQLCTGFRSIYSSPSGAGVLRVPLQTRRPVRDAAPSRRAARVTAFSSWMPPMPSGFGPRHPGRDRAFPQPRECLVHSLYGETSQVTYIVDGRLKRIASQAGVHQARRGRPRGSPVFSPLPLDEEEDI